MDCQTGEEKSYPLDFLVERTGELMVEQLEATKRKRRIRRTGQSRVRVELAWPTERLVPGNWGLQDFPLAGRILSPVADQSLVLQTLVALNLSDWVRNRRWDCQLGERELAVAPPIPLLLLASF